MGCSGLGNLLFSRPARGSRIQFHFSTTCRGAATPRIILRETNGERVPMSEAENKPILRTKGRLMSASEIERTLVRLAHEPRRTAG